MTIRVLAVILVCLLLGSLQAAENRVVKLNGGLEAEIISVGRSANHHDLTTAMRIVNKGKSTAYLLMVGQALVADNTGVTCPGWFAVNGIAYCQFDFHVCVGLPKETEGRTVSLQAYTQIDPEVGITVTSFCSGGESKGPLVSFSANVAYRLVADPSADAGLSEKDKRLQIRTMSLSFPPTSVTDAK